MRETDGGLSNYKLNFTEPLGFEWLMREKRTLQSSVFSNFFFQILRILRFLVQINGAALWLITLCGSSLFQWKITKLETQSLRMKMLNAELYFKGLQFFTVCNRLQQEASL